MSTQVLKCGCIFDGKSFEKYCREHALMVLQKRAENSSFGKVLAHGKEPKA